MDIPPVPVQGTGGNLGAFVNILTKRKEIV